MTTPAHHKEFEVELMALLRKYDCEMSVRTGYCYAGETVEGIDVDFAGIYTPDHCDIIRSFSTLELPTHLFGR